MNGIDDIRELLIELTNKTNTLAGERCDEEIKCFLMSAALRIWSSNKMYAEAYVQALSAFDGTKYTDAQIVTALDCAGEQKRSLAIPVYSLKCGLFCRISCRKEIILDKSHCARYPNK